MFLLIDYIRLGFPCINVEQEHLLHISENLKKLKFCSTLRELAGRYLSIILKKANFNCNYCDVPCRGNYVYVSIDSEINYDLLGMVLQYVNCLLPYLV